VTPRPPRLAGWLLERSLRPADREVVAGDLAEEFAMRAARDGVGGARRWYRRQVRRSIGPSLRNRAGRTHDAREVVPRARLLSGVIQDFSQAIRGLRATPGFTIVALAVLALGIGATTTIFSVVDGVALRGLPYPDDSRIMTVTEPRATGRDAPAGLPDVRDWREAQTSFEALATWRGGGRNFVAHDSGAAQALRVAIVSANLFPTLRASAATGRTFTPDDEVPGRDHVAILSDAFWRTHFGADPHVIGRTMTLDRGVWTIVGVMPAAFMFPPALTTPMDVWVPEAPTPNQFNRTDRTTFNVQVIGRLKRGVTIDRARADLERIIAPRRPQFPDWFRNRGLNVLPLQELLVGGSVRAWMLMLLGAVGFVLLIACVNVANLLLARAAARARDVAVRAALGASRWRIVRGQLAESLVLSAAGSAIGVCLAVWGVHVLRSSLPATLPRASEIGVNARVLVAAAAAMVAVAIGVTPIWPSTGSRTLRESGRSATAGAPRQRIRTALLVAEVAMAVVLLVGSGLFMSSFVRLMSVDLGYNLGNLLSIDVSPPAAGARRDDSDFARFRATADAMMEAIRRIPGVEAVSLVSGTPPLLLGSDRTSVTVPGRPMLDTPDDRADDKLVDARYFSVLHVPVLAGRAFTDDDCRAGATPVAILNDVAAQRYFGGASPIGASINMGASSFAVVGVVRSIRLQGPESDLRPEVYTPLGWQTFRGNPVLTLVVRTSGDASRVVLPVRAALRATAPMLVSPNVETYAHLFAGFVAQRRFNMIALVLFGVVALAIAAAGIYGVMAYLVEQRTPEIGVRMALGAEPAHVLAMVLGRALMTMAVGLAIGLIAGWMLSRFVRAFLYKSDAHDLVIYAGAAVVLVGAGLVAAFVPARRASRVDPVIALRAD
jgi:predicted permease